MYQPRSIQSSLNFRDKFFSIDYILVLSVLILGIISMFAMYSTDGGEFKYHTKSHIIRFFFFLFYVLYFILLFKYVFGIVLVILFTYLFLFYCFVLNILD